MRFEIWVSTLTQYEAVCGMGEMRFNASFEKHERAIQERSWYEARGYHVNLIERISYSPETVPG